MIDAQALNLAFADQPQEQPVRILKNRGILHTHRGQLGNVEESAVVDLFSRHAPEGQPVGLPIQQRVQPIETRWLALLAVDGLE